MADKKISDLPLLGDNAAAGDLLEVLDISDTSESAEGTSKALTQAELVGAPAAATVTYDDGGVPITASQVQAALDQGVFSNPIETGETSVTRIVQIGQADFDNIGVPDPSTFYVINGV